MNRTKETTKNISNLGLVPPLQRSLRSRKRGFPDDKIAQSTNEQSKPLPEDTEMNSLTPAELSQSMPDQQGKVALQKYTEEQGMDSGQEANSSASSLMATSSCAELVMGKAIQETRCGTSVLTSCVKLEVIPLSYHTQDKEDEKKAHEYSKSTCKTTKGQVLPVSVEGKDDADCAAAFDAVQLQEEHYENRVQSNKGSQQESNSMCIAEDMDSGIEPAMDLPLKKRRMGMCVLTEKERSHFLQKQQKKEQTEGEENRVEDGVCSGESRMELNKDKTSNEESDVVADEETPISMLNASLPQSVLLGTFTNQREVETEVQPRIYEAFDRPETEPHTLVPALTSPSKDCGQRQVSDIDANCQAEKEGSKNGQVNVLIQSDHQQEEQSSNHQMYSLARTEELCMKVTPDPFGSGSLDYISDSQLNNITLIDEQGELMGVDGGHSSDCYEDATDLVCGLIRELSSLNRIVMAAKRKLEILRRGNKGPKAH